MILPIKIGFRKVSNTMTPLYVDLKSNCHWLICGPSGSGKSYLLKYLFNSLLEYQSLIEIFCLDFKRSGDYEFMDDAHLSSGVDCVEMLDRIYQRYTEIKEKNLSDIVLCCFDEYAAFATWISAYDKKQGKKATDQMAEMLMMGRRLNKAGGGAYIMTVLQRPDATYFGSARDNYMVKVVMKDVTRSIRTMLEIDEDDIPKEHIAETGRGICILNDDVYSIIVPKYDEIRMDKLLKHKRKKMNNAR